MIKVLVVDDSAVVRKVLSEELSKYDDIEIVGTAVDPYIARDKIVRLKPDVVTLDIEMPRMDGLSFLAKLMKYYPIPVVVVSSLTPKNSELAIRALELGAVEVFHKPDSSFSAPEVSRQLVRAIRAAASSKVARKSSVHKPDVLTKGAKESKGEKIGPIETTHKVIAIGASTGGVQAIESLLTNLSGNLPGIVIAQHMPALFTKSFASRLNQICPMEVREAQDGDLVVNGVALIAPGGKHMLLQRNGALYCVRIKDGPPVNYQKPSIDVLFQSVKDNAGPNAIGVLLTGMGVDGAKGLLEMRRSGAYTIAEDESTCVVFGMPKEAIRIGAADEVVPLYNIPNAIISALKRRCAHTN